MRVAAFYWRLLGAAIAALLLCVASGAAAEQRYSAFGLVLEIEGTHSFKVSCKDIPGFMDAMAMGVEVRNPEELKAIRPGMLVDFTLVVGTDSPYAEHIKVHEFQSPDQRALDVQMLTMLQGTFANESSVGPMLAVGERVPEFTLLNQYRRQVNFSDGSGKVVAISFVYTKCSFSEYCFRLSNNLGLTAKRFPDRMGKDLILLTITFDPATDSPEVLAKYAQNWKASSKGWYFLTGPPADVKRVCLLFGMNFWPDMGMIVHTMHTAVINREGRLVANLEGNDFSTDQLGDLIEIELGRKRPIDKK
jgi:protein SCO1